MAAGTVAIMDMILGKVMEARLIDMLPIIVIVYSWTIDFPKANDGQPCFTL
jgi:hypothetical protein